VARIYNYIRDMEPICPDLSNPFVDHLVIRLKANVRNRISEALTNVRYSSYLNIISSILNTSSQKEHTRGEKNIEIQQT
jgi:hypothetical protein